MRTLLIAHKSEELVSVLTAMLSQQFCVMSCGDGETAVKLMRSLQPDYMILDIMLPFKDGFTVLEESYWQKPEVVIATTDTSSNYIINNAISKHIDYMFVSPTPPRMIVTRLFDIIEQKASLQHEWVSIPKTTTDILLRLKIPAERDGFAQLRVGIPIFATDPAQRLSKELYPAIAKICGNGTGQQVEHSIRTAIEAGWSNGDPQIWDQYFPTGSDGIRKCPTNKMFITTLAAIINP